MTFGRTLARTPASVFGMVGRGRRVCVRFFYRLPLELWVFRKKLRRGGGYGDAPLPKSRMIGVYFFCLVRGCPRPKLVAKDDYPFRPWSLGSHCVGIAL